MPPESGPNPPPRRFVDHPDAPAVALLLLILQVYLWFLTYGSGAVFHVETLGQFYDAQATSLLHGRWDVPHRDIAPEAFVRNGKSYGYFGPTPAVWRMPLNALFPAMWGCWSRCSCLAAGAGALLFSYLILIGAGRWTGDNEVAPARRRWTAPLFLTGVGLGSILLYLQSRAWVYHEAGLWGNALALAAYYAMLQYLLRGRTRWFALACTLAFAAFFARATFGAGAMLAILLLMVQTLRRRPPVRSRPAIAILGLATLIITTVCAMAINRAKFGSPLAPMPMQYYEQMLDDPPRYARTGGVTQRLGNFPTNAVAYFWPTTVRFSRHFPWLYVDERLRRFACSKMDGNGSAAAITVTMPWLFFLALFGFGWVLFKQVARSPLSGVSPSPPPQSPGPLLVGATIGAMPVLFHFAAEHRYEFDFLPALILSAAFGLQRLTMIRNRVGWRCIAVVYALTLGWSVYANTALALVHQRMRVFDVPDAKKEQFQIWRRTIDRQFGVEPDDEDGGVSDASAASPVAP